MVSGEATASRATWTDAGSTCRWQRRRLAALVLAVAGTTATAVAALLSAHGKVTAVLGRSPEGHASVGNTSKSSNNSSGSSRTGESAGNSYSLLPSLPSMVEPATTEVVVVDDECSCRNTDANRTCCLRAVLRAHKMGHVLVDRLFGPLCRKHGLRVDLPGKIEPSSFPAGDDSSRGSGCDYRHTVLVRNFREALVSGYLYHRSGRECWLTAWGRPCSDRKHCGRLQLLRGWRPAYRQSRVVYPRLPELSSPSNASMCHYLLDHEEEVGMMAYIAASLSDSYGGLRQYLRMARERNKQGEPTATKSLFVCFEDLSNPRKQDNVFHAMVDFLYPGPHNFTFARQDKPEAKTTPRAYAGLHASDPDPVLRYRLLDVVRGLDRDVFDGDLARIDDLIGCNGTIQ